MVTKELEGESPQVEGAEPTPGMEGAEPTQPQGDATVGKTYTEKDFRRALDTALGKGLESTNKQLSLRKKEAEAAKVELAEYKATATTQLEDLRAELEERAREHDEALRAAEDDTIRKSYTDRTALAKKEREATRREKAAEEKLYKAERLVYVAGMEKLADSKVKELKEAGYDTQELQKQLEDCNTEDEIEIVALRYQLSRMPKKTEPQGLPKFDSGASSGAGGLPEHPTTEQMERWTPEQYAKWANKRYEGK